MAQNQADTPEVPGLASLTRLFARALWASKVGSAGNAYSEIKRATKAGEKSEIIRMQFAAWKQGCVSAIKDFFPQYVELGCKYQAALKSGPVEWAAERTWEALYGMCGVKKLGEQGSHSFDSVRWWLAVATENNPAVNLPEAKAWYLPRWLAKPRSILATNQLFQNLLDQFGVHFFDVLDEEMERARVKMALNSVPPIDTSLGSPQVEATGKLSSKSKSKPLSRTETQRRKVIFGAIQAGLKGPKYCKTLDERKLPVPLAWTEDGCPSRYVEAYKARKWQKRIQDEKNRYQKKYDQTPETELENLL